MGSRPQYSSREQQHMELALRLARKGLGKTYPNPAVGAVVARGATVLGKGYHHRAGGPHAEVEALRDCRRQGHSPRGATLFVTLEPCNHQGQTPPCTEAIVAAGIRRVVIAARDPNRTVIGKGLGRLRQAGLQVDCGLFEDRARALNEAFYRFHKDGRPWVTVKWAMTLDGCTSARTGDSFWITGEEARRDGHRLRAHHACVAVGVQTVINDNPRLTVRMIPWDGPVPLRLVMDSRLRIPEDARILGETPRGILVATCVPPGTRKAQRLSARGVRLIHLTSRDASKRVPLRQLLKRLWKLGVQSILVEGGRRVAGAFFAAGVVDRVVAYLAPSLMGSGEKALSPLLGGATRRAAAVVRLAGIRITRLGADFRIEGYPQREKTRRRAGKREPG